MKKRETENKKMGKLNKVKLSTRCKIDDNEIPSSKRGHSVKNEGRNNNNNVSENPRILSEIVRNGDRNRKKKNRGKQSELNEEKEKKNL